MEESDQTGGWLKQLEHSPHGCVDLPIFGIELPPIGEKSGTAVVQKGGQSDAGIPIGGEIVDTRFGQNSLERNALFIYANDDASTQSFFNKRRKKRRNQNLSKPMARTKAAKTKIDRNGRRKTP